MRVRTPTCLVLLAWALATTETGYATPVQRADLQEKLASIICSQPSKKPHTLELWQHGVFDADIEIEVISGAADPVANLIAAQQMAATLGYNGFLAGQCTDTSLSWRAATPGNTPLTMDTETLELPLTVMGPVCERIVVDFAASDLTTPRLLQNISTDTNAPIIRVQRRYLGGGSLGVTCLSRKSSGRSSQLWHLVPHAPLPASLAPHTDKVSESDLNRAMLQWVNMHRADHKLAPLVQVSSQLQGIQRSYAGTNGHNLQAIHWARRTLNRQDLQTTNVVSVSGGNRRELLWTLWNTPQHRRALLNPRSTHISMMTAADSYSLKATLLLTQKQARQ